MWVFIVGVILLGLELLVGGFYLLWYGLGLALSGGIGWMLGSQAWMAQAIIGLLIGLGLMILFQKRFSQGAKGIKDEFLLQEGEGIVQEGGMVEFRGTLWRYDSPKGESFEAGERVKVVPGEGNWVKIAKKD